MASLDMKTEILCHFTPQEFKLVCKGLAGILSDAEKEEAHKLGDLLTRQRLTISNNTIMANERLLASLDKAATEREMMHYDGK